MGDLQGAKGQQIPEPMSERRTIVKAPERGGAGRGGEGVEEIQEQFQNKNGQN